MEYAILAAQTDDLNRLVDALKREMEPELSPTSFSISFDRKSESGEARLLVFEEHSAGGFMTRSGYYTGTALFEAEGQGRCVVTIVITGGSVNTGGTHTELRILDSIKNPILKIGEDVNIIYDSAWLYDKDENVRQKAVSSIDRISGESIVDKLLQILSHDGSNIVLESTVLSLGRAGSDDAIDSIAALARKKTSLVMSCAKALGDIHSQKALESLKELLAYFELRELVAEAKSVRHAIQRSEYGEDYKEVTCAVCDQPIEEGEQVVECPWCRKIAHKTHMLEWLHVHGKCPSCGHDLTDSELVERSAQSNLEHRKASRTP